MRIPLGSGAAGGPGALRLLPFLNSAKIAHVTQDCAADAACFRYQCEKMPDVITVFRAVITRTGGRPPGRPPPCPA